MSRQNYGVARVVTHTKDTISKYERHNEHYGNMNVVLILFLRIFLLFWYNISH